MKLFKPQKPVAKSSNRQIRLCMDVQRFISNLMIRKTLPPVQLDGRILTADPLMIIARADVSPDMKNAKIYVRHLEEEKLKIALTYLDAMKSVIRHTMAKELNMRFTPDLSFHSDTTIEEEDRINQIFENIRTPVC